MLKDKYLVPFSKQKKQLLRIIITDFSTPNLMYKILFSLFVTFLFTTFAEAQVLYVKADAGGANNGQSWTDAYTDLQNAIGAATYGTQIWVAVGTYKPTDDFDRNARFTLNNGVQIYGGFLGTETDLAQRDYIHNETILSGDIGIVGDSLDNSYTVVFSQNTDENTILEGFTIRDGNASVTDENLNVTVPERSGGGVYLSADGGDLSCQIKHCTFRNNTAHRQGGGLQVIKRNFSSAHPVIFANNFYENRAFQGGGYNVQGGTTVIVENYIADSLIFENNIAFLGGGMSAILGTHSAKTFLRNCVFTENLVSKEVIGDTLVSGGAGGGLYLSESGFENQGAELIGCQFYYNSSDFRGGGFWYLNSEEFTNLTLDSCVFDHNSITTTFNTPAFSGGGIYLDAFSTNAEPNETQKIRFIDCEMNWNTAEFGGAVAGSFLEGPITVEVENSLFQFNGAEISGGALYIPDSATRLRVQSSYFLGNGAQMATGGAIHVQSDDTKISNSIFDGNSAATGGGIRMINGEVMNCLFYQNQAVQQGGGIRCRQPTIANCIFWDNQNFGIGPDIFNNSFPLTVNNCLFSEASCEAINYNNSNISCDAGTIFGIDPQFLNPADTDFRTAANSVTRDAGDDALYTADYDTDFYGNARIANGSIDIGVYEISEVSIASVNIAVLDCPEESLQNGIVEYTLSDALFPAVITFGEQEITVNEPSGSIENIATGSYDFSVTDAAGNTAMTSIFIPTQPVPTLTFDKSPPTCSDFTNGFVQLNIVGENQPYDLLWDNGTSDTGQFGLGGGDYGYTVTDAFGCQVSGTESLAAPAEIMTNGTVQNTLCDNDASGQISIDPTGGTGNLSAAWSNNQTGNQIFGLSAGAYIVTVTDENNCSAAAQFIVENGEALDFSAAVTDAGCADAATGSIALTPLNGTPNYSYQWSNDATTATLQNLVPGTYTVTATDGNGCTFVQSYDVNFGSPLSFSSLVTPVSCHGDTDGSIVLEVNDPTGLTFIWSDNTDGQTGTSLTNLAPDLYFLTVTDADDCPSYAEFLVEEPTLIALTLASENPSCLGGFDGMISAFAEGGTTAEDCPYSFTVFPALPEAGCGLFTSAFAGIYTVTATDVNGCETSATVTLAAGPEVDLPLTAELTDINCFGENNGAITLTSTENYTYEWSENANGQTGNSLNNLTAGTYTATIVSEAGCSDVQDFTLTEPTQMNLEFITENITCAGGNDGSIILTTSGGTPVGDCGYVYAITPALPQEGCNIFTAATAGTYEITATDGSGCTLTQNVTVTASDPVTADFSVEEVSCFGENDGSVIVTPAGGTAPYTVTGETENLPAGDYEILVSDANNCASILEFTVTQPDSLTAEITTQDVLCFGEATGSAQFVVSGGTAPYLFDNNVDNLSPGDYVITVIDANFCDLEMPFTINQTEQFAPTVTINNATNSNSNDGSIIIENVTGGTAPFTFAWSNGDTTQSLENVSAGTYTLTVTDANDCTYSFGFGVDAMTATQDLLPEGYKFSLTPTILQEGNRLFLNYTTPQNTALQAEIFNAVGQRKDVEVFETNAAGRAALQARDLPAGIYFTVISEEGRRLAVLEFVISNSDF